MSEQKTVFIIGAGPAGLTAAIELLERASFKVIVCEQDPHYVGGISRTVNYKGNRIDLGGHRFFSKSDRVMLWWNRYMPVDAAADASVDITYQRSSRALTKGLARTTGNEGDAAMHVRPRKTRIIHGNRFFAYPVELSLDTLVKLGPIKILRVGFTYVWATLFPRRPETTLEDFFINRFGTELYETFFKSYTEKVWGVPCTSLSAEWGAQRVKGLSIMRALIHAARKATHIGPLSGKTVETSLIEQFLYPTFGPGQLWEKVRDAIVAKGGEVRMGTEVVELRRDSERLVEAVVRGADGTVETLQADYVFSTTDIRSLMRMIQPAPPAEVLAVSDKLEFRDFLTIGLLLERLPTESDGTPLTDTWMYVHETNLSVGRIQLFHNWHPRLVAEPGLGRAGIFRPGGRCPLEHGRCCTDRVRQARVPGAGLRARHSRARRYRHPAEEGLSRLLRRLQGFRRRARLARSDGEPIPGRPQRHAPLQQPGSFDAHGHDGRGQHHRRRAHQGQYLEREHRAGLSRGEDLGSSPAFLLFGTKH